MSTRRGREAGGRWQVGTLVQLLCISGSSREVAVGRIQGPVQRITRDFIDVTRVLKQTLSVAGSRAPNVRARAGATTRRNFA